MIKKQESLEDRLYKYAERLNKEFEEAKEQADHSRQKPETYETEQRIHLNYMEAVRFNATYKFYEHFPEIKKEAYRR